MRRNRSKLFGSMVAVSFSLMTLQPSAQENPRGLAISRTVQVQDAFSPLLPQDVQIHGGFLGARIAYMTSADGGLVVNLYNDNVITTRLKSGMVTIEQKTHYPLGGDVAFRILPARYAQRFPVRLRIPAGTSSFKVRLNGRSAPADEVNNPKSGYVLFRGTDAKAIFAEFERRLHICHSVSGDLTGMGPNGPVLKSSFLLQKPRSFRIIDGQIDMYCNGKVQYNHLVAEKEYFKRDVSNGFGFGAPTGLDSFLGIPTGSNAPYFVKKTEFRMQTVDGHMCAAKAMHFESFDRDDRMVFFVDRDSKQLLGWDQVFSGTKVHYRFENIRFDVDVPKDAFEWKPTPELKERMAGR